MNFKSSHAIILYIFLLLHCHYILSLSELTYPKRHTAKNKFIANSYSVVHQNQNKYFISFLTKTTMQLDYLFLEHFLNPEIKVEPSNMCVTMTYNFI